ncbi:MAG: 4'-phosphopantetheinyl transferase superfamily protein [Prolixibacteraceae bacterium]|nr:4'-phosphopantetheinyl transferase superfamily protein [Prolixibacteraceae bacterium]
MNWLKSDSLQEITGSNDLVIVYGTNSMAENPDLHEILTPEELIYADRLKGSGQKSTWLSCRSALRLILGSYLKKPPIEIEFRKGRFGKPFIVGTNLCFNVSHTNRSFLLAFNSSGRIGVDIEMLTGKEDLQLLIRYAFSDAETNYCNNGNLAERFTEVWTRKEALLKAAGIGLVDQLTAITVTGTTGNDISRLKLNSKTFTCPNGETGSIVYRKDQPIRFFVVIKT